MDIICVGRGNATLGRRQIGTNGEVVSETKAHWEPDQEGGCVAVWPMDAETKEITGPADVFGDWDAARYLEKVLELLGKKRPINIPNLKTIVRAAEKDGVDLCEYCREGCWKCKDCIVQEWKEDSD